jgi:hypothetical protein
VNDEFRNKMSKITKGRKISEKHKQALSDKAKDRYSNPNYKERWFGKNNPNFGKGIKGEKTQILERSDTNLADEEKNTNVQSRERNQQSFLW